MYTNVSNQKRTLSTFPIITSIVTIINYELLIFSGAVSRYPLILLTPTFPTPNPSTPPLPVAG